MQVKNANNILDLMLLGKASGGQEGEISLEGLLGDLGSIQEGQADGKVISFMDILGQETEKEFSPEEIIDLENIVNNQNVITNNVLPFTTSTLNKIDQGKVTTNNEQKVNSKNDQLDLKGILNLGQDENNQLPEVRVDRNRFENKAPLDLKSILKMGSSQPSIEEMNGDNIMANDSLDKDVTANNKLPLTFKGLGKSDKNQQIIPVTNKNVLESELSDFGSYKEMINIKPSVQSALSSFSKSGNVEKNNFLNANNSSPELNMLSKIDAGPSVGIPLIQGKTQEIQNFNTQGMKKTAVVTNGDQAQEVVGKILDYLVVQTGKGVDSAEVQFNHGDLGNIKIKVEKLQSKDGIELQILTSKSETQQMLSQRKAELIGNLNDSGIKLSDFKLTNGSSFNMKFSEFSESSKNERGFEQNSSNQKFDRGSNQEFSQDQNSKRRQQLWNQYRDSLGA